MKKIVTHLRPDLDACASVWLVKKYLPGFSEATIEFVPAGKTYEGNVADIDVNIVHVDTGYGRFDHHQLKERSSATKRVADYVIKEGIVGGIEAEVLLRVAEVVTMIDNFEESALPNPAADYYDLSLHQLIEGYKYVEHDDNVVIVFGDTGLEAFYANMRHKLVAEQEVKKGQQFMIGNWKCLAIETRSEDAVSLAQKLGYSLVIRKDPKTGRARIKVRPDISLTLEKVHQALTSRDRPDQWFYHMSGKMVLNGSSKNPTIEPTNLTLAQITQIVTQALS